MIWAVFALCIVAAFVLSGLESALLTVSRVRARHAASEGDKQAAALAALLERRNELAQAAIAANHVFSLIAFVVLAQALQQRLGPKGIALAAVLALPVFLIGLELVPKSLFRRYPFRLLKRALPVLHSLEVFTLPWRFCDRWLKPLTTQDAEPANGAGLTTLIASISRLNVLPAQAAALLHQFGDFNLLTVSDFMRSFNNLSALPADLPLSTAVQMARETKRRHFPIMDETGALIGYLDAAALPPGFAPDKLVRQFAQPMVSVRSIDTAMGALQALRRAGAPLALVTDAKGEAVGVVSLKELIARLLLLKRQ